MAEYYFTDYDGNIIVENYKNPANVTPEQILSVLCEAFNQFPYQYSITQAKDLEDIFIVTSNDNAQEDIVICAKATTPGGRSGLKNEQRIQAQAKFLNFVYDSKKNGKMGVFLGVYLREKRVVFCTWKVAQSMASNESVPISKQIKIETIAKAIKEGFARQDKGKGEYVCAFKPEFLYFYLNNLDWLHGGIVSDSTKDETEEIDTNRLEGGRNVLLYGVPGSGKSHTIKNTYCVDANGIERVVFHPDYTYGDFVGQILPITDADGKIRYKFTAGPFTRILREAYLKPGNKYCLIIEEINRGNAPAIFGDIFQLLDRDEKGNSTYDITNADVADIVYGAESGMKLSIPSNLFIFATMNTSDQNVFTLDTAFQRRWDMRMVENNVAESKIAKFNILDTDVTWETFNKRVNELILAKNVGMVSSEDKRLGAYFVTESDLHFYTTEDGLDQKEADDKNHNFPEKVLKYLWDDAFKFVRDEVFKEEFDSLEKLIKAFETKNGNSRFDIFLDDIFNLSKAE